MTGQIEKVITSDELAFLVNPFIGKEVSRPWKGHGSAVFLEFGRLTDGKGELTIMIEWSWRVKKENSILFGSWREPDELSAYIAGLKGATLVNIAMQCRLPELSVELSSRRWPNSFSTVEGEPEWALLLPGSTISF